MDHPDLYDAIDKLKRAWIVATTVAVALVFLIKAFQAELAIERATPGTNPLEAISFASF